METVLKRLPTERVKYRIDEFLAGPLDAAEKQAEPFHRSVDTEPLIGLTERAMKDSDDREPALSDQWLAPRVHAALPLYRHEAADPAIWFYLSAATHELHDYTAWRWATESAQGRAIDTRRISGPENRQALSRLWWIAELTRNGSSYEPTVEACTLQETIQWLLDVDAFQNPYATQAFIRFIRDVNGGRPPTGDQVRDYARKLNLLLKTVVLDAVAPDPGRDMNAMQRWVDAGPDEATLSSGNLPSGPQEDPLDEDEIHKVAQLLTRLKPAREQAAPVAV